MATYSGYTTETAKSLLLDAGAFFKNFYVGTDTFESAVAAGKLLGATQGGGSFTATPEIRQIEIDGIKGVAKGMQAIDQWAVTLSANVKEVKKSTLQTALAASKVDSTSNNTYDIISANNEIVLTDYIDNITWVGRLSGTVEPVIIQVYNALNTTGLTVNAVDKSEAVLNLTFTGHYVDTDLDTPPFKIFYPKPIVNTGDKTAETFAKGSPADIAIVVTSSGGAACDGVSVDGKHIVSTAYTLGDTVTLKSGYLSTLTNAVYTVVLLMGKGNNITVNLTVSGVGA